LTQWEISDAVRDSSSSINKPLGRLHEEYLCGWTAHRLKTQHKIRYFYEGIKFSFLSTYSTHNINTYKIVSVFIIPVGTSPDSSRKP